MKRQITMIALAAALAAPSAFAITDAQLKAVKKSLNSVPVPELPAKAADLVKQAAKEDREAVAVTVVRAAIYKSRPSAPLVVAAVSKVAPEVAAPVSRVAAEMEAGQSGSIAAAASGAAPAQKTEIVSAVQHGAYGASSSGVTVSSFAGSSTATTVAESSAAASLTARGSARTVNGGHGSNKSTPINDSNGHGRFPTNPPFTVPPGHDPNHDGKPSFVDYTKPRQF